MSKRKWGMNPRPLPVLSIKEIEDYYGNKDELIDDTNDNSLSDYIFNRMGEDQANIKIAKNNRNQPKKKQYPRVDYLEPVKKRVK